MSTLTFALPVPPSANNLFVNVPGRGRAKSPAYRQWINDAGWLAKSATVGQASPQPPYRVAYQIPRSRKGDIANCEKAASDLLVMLRLIEDDSLIDRMEIERVDRKDMLVTIAPYPAVTPATGSAASAALRQPTEPVHD